MNYMSSPSKKIKKFNVIDAIIIIAVVACIAGVLFRLFINKSDLSAEEYSVTFTANGLAKEEISMIALDAEVYITENGSRKAIGTVADNNIESVADIFKVERDCMLVKDENGVYTEAYYPEGTLYMIEGRITVSGGYGSDGGFSSTSGVKLAPGMSLLVFTETADLEITVTEIVKK